MKSRAIQQIRCLFKLLWRIRETISRIQISVDTVVAENDLAQSRKAVYLIGILLLMLFMIAFPDKIPSILSTSGVDTAIVSERMHMIIKTVRRLLPTF